MLQMDEMINILADEMGSAVFSDIVDFDMEISESDYDYKILMGRRFFVLHTGLAPLIKYNYKNDFREKGSFMTNLSIVLEKDLSEKRVLIIDDTLLHGRAIKNMVADLISCGCRRENIRVSIYLRNKDAQIIDKSLLQLSDCRRERNMDMWRYASAKIVDAFMASGWPYMYWLPYYKAPLSSDKARVITDFLKNEKLLDHASKTQKKYGISSYLYRSRKKPPMCREFLARIYRYEKLNELLLIPYAYLKPLTYAQIAGAFIILKEKNAFSCHGNGSFLEKADMLKENRLKAQYAYALLTYITSLLCGSHFLANLGLAGWEWIRGIEENSLKCSISFSRDSREEILSDLEKIKVIENIDGPLEENEDITHVLNSLATGRNDVVKQKGVDTDYFLDHYLKLSSKRDEQLAARGKERMRGIEIERICQNVSDRENIWKKVEEVIDTGRGTIAVATNWINGAEHVDSLLYAGEQNHACNENNLAKLVYPLLQYEAYCKRERISDKTKENAKDGIIAAIMRQNSELQGKISRDEIAELKGESFAQNYAAYYYDKYPLFREEVMQEMKIERGYEGRGNDTEDDDRAACSFI